MSETIPVFDALTGCLRYVFRLRIEGRSFLLPILNRGGDIRLIAVPLTIMGFPGKDGPLRTNICIAAEALLRELDKMERLPDWVHRIPCPHGVTGP